MDISNQLHTPTALSYETAPDTPLIGDLGLQRLPGH
jgi:hypothetical protein